MSRNLDSIWPTIRSALDDAAPPISAQEVASRASRPMYSERQPRPDDAPQPDDHSTPISRKGLPVGPLVVAAAVIFVVIGGLVALANLRSATQTQTIATSPPDETDTTPTVEILEPEAAVVSDFGGGWVLDEQWHVEAGAGIRSGCGPYDVIAAISSYGGVHATWVNGGSRLSQRTATLGGDAAGYLRVAQMLPETCPVVNLGQQVQVTTANISTPSGTAYMLDVFPIASPATDGSVPDLATAGAWVITLRRANVISTLTIEATPAVTEVEAIRLAGVLQSTLDQAPAQVANSTPAASSAPTLGAEEAVTLVLDHELCRNDGTAEAFGFTWVVVELVPLNWQGNGDRFGSLIFTGSEFATFTDSDGTTLQLTSGDTEGECEAWDED